MVNQKRVVLSLRPPTKITGNYLAYKSLDESKLIDVEILVVGAGPAGLLAASYLAREHRVALVERASLGKTTKYWVTTKRRLEKHALEHCTLHSASSVVIGTFLGGQVRAPGDLVVVEEGALLRELISRCVQYGAILPNNAV